jgi:hypothetical protein
MDYCSFAVSGREINGLKEIASHGQGFWGFATVRLLARARIIRNATRGSQFGQSLKKADLLAACCGIDLSASFLFSW